MKEILDLLKIMSDGLKTITQSVEAIAEKVNEIAKSQTSVKPKEENSTSVVPIENTTKNSRIMLNRSSAKTLSDIILSWVTVTSLILGGLWAILEYKDRQKSAITDKVSEVLKFVERYNSDPLQKYRDNKIKALAESYRTHIRETETREPSDLLKFQEEVVDKYDLRFEIDNITFFYDELYECVKSEICDEQIAHNFFGKHAFDFRWGLQKYIPDVKRVREIRGVIDYAEGLNYFVEAYYKKHHGEGLMNN